jgi:hypothetical protein
MPLSVGLCNYSIDKLAGQPLKVSETTGGVVSDSIPPSKKWGQTEVTRVSLTGLSNDI